MIGKKFFSLIWVFLILFIFFLNFEKGGTYYNFSGKRGYILDRRGEPIVINKESFQAYYLTKGKSMLGQDFPDELKSYLPKLLDLPERGVILLSENFSYDEAQKLRNIKNVYIKSTMERKVLYPNLKALVGTLSNNKGLLGLEKAFDEILQRGGCLQTSLDVFSIKKLHNLIKIYPSYGIKGGAQFDMRTGELLSYYSKEGKEWLSEPLKLSNTLDINLPEKVSWELGSYELSKRENQISFTPLHLATTYLRASCDTLKNPTILFTPDIPCKDIEHEEKENFIYLEDTGEWIYLYLRGKILTLLMGEFDFDKEPELSLQKFVKNLKYIIINNLYNG